MTLSYAVRRVLEHYPTLSEAAATVRLRYSTFVNLDRRYMYFEVPKAGCTTIKSLIHRLENLPPIAPFTGALREVRRDMFIHNRSQFALKSLLDHNDAQQEEILTSPDIFRFSVVRNPYSRLLSAWSDKVRQCSPGYESFYKRLAGGLPAPDGSTPPLPFETFVADISRHDIANANPHWRMQSAHLLADAIPLSFIGRLEDLNAAITLFLQKAGFDQNARAGAMNPGGGASSHYTEALARQVWSLYEPDFQAFGYDRESWRPKPQLHKRMRKHPPKHPLKHPPGYVPESRHLAELIERNIVIGALYAQRDNLRTVKEESELDRLRHSSFDQLQAGTISPTQGRLTVKETKLLFEAAQNVTAGCIVDIGSRRGRATVALALGAVAGHDVPVYAIDTGDSAHDKDTAMDRGHLLMRLMHTGLFHRVHLINLGSAFLGQSWPQPVGLLWINAGPGYEELHQEFTHWRPKLAGGAQILIGGVSPGSGALHFVDELVAAGAILAAPGAGMVRRFVLR